MGQVTRVLSAAAVLLAAGPAAGKDVKGTFTIGGTACEVTFKLDGGATGPGASELTRAEARRCGLIKADGTFDAAQFQTNPDGSIKKIRAKQADGTVIEYALSKPIEIEVPDDNGTKCKASIPVTVICDPAKTGSNLLGRDWGALAKVTETWADDKATWPNNPAEATKKKTKTVEESETPPGTDTDVQRKVMDGVSYFDGSGGSVSGSAFLMLSSDHTLLTDDLASALGLTPTGQIDLSSDAEFLDALLKSGFYAESASDFGVFDTALLPRLEILADDGTPLAGEDIPVLINTAGDLNVFGRDLFLTGLTTIGGLPFREFGYLHETQVFFASPVPEPGSLALLALGGAGLVGGAVRRGRKSA
ncbi:MAG TPA: PEP-CTERM sorting domain-containing protein [Planctomycetaceae bacterium]